MEVKSFFVEDILMNWIAINLTKINGLFIMDYPITGFKLFTMHFDHWKQLYQYMYILCHSFVFYFSFKTGHTQQLSK